MYSNASTSSLEVDKVRRSKVVYSILGYRPFNKSNSLSCFNKVGSWGSLASVGGRRVGSKAKGGGGLDLRGDLDRIRFSRLVTFLGQELIIKLLNVY